MNTGKHELGRTRAGKVHPLTCRVIWHRFFFLQEFHEDIARQLNIPEDAVSDALNITSKLLAAPDYLFETGKHRVLTTGGEKIAEGTYIQRYPRNPLFTSF
jgi:hypothetical protein